MGGSVRVAVEGSAEVVITAGSHLVVVKSGERRFLGLPGCHDPEVL